MPSFKGVDIRSSAVPPEKPLMGVMPEGDDIEVRTAGIRVGKGRDAHVFYIRIIIGRNRVEVYSGPFGVIKGKHGGGHIFRFFGTFDRLKAEEECRSLIEKLTESRVGRINKRRFGAERREETEEVPDPIGMFVAYLSGGISAAITVIRILKRNNLPEGKGFAAAVLSAIGPTVRIGGSECRIFPPIYRGSEVTAVEK